MAKFDAGTAVEALEYDFERFVPECKGIIPEPTTDQLDAYFNEVRALAKDVQAIKAEAEAAQHRDEDSEMTDEEVDAIIAKMDDISIAKFQNQMVGALGRLCSQQPSEEDISKLPHRVKQAFLQWVTGEFRPEAQAPISRG